MTYFKIIQNGTVIDAGFTFLTWVEKYKQLYISEVEGAQFVQAASGKTYHDIWLKPVPDGAVISSYEEATIQIINKTEYDDIIAVLESGETLEVVDNETPDEIPPPEEYISEEVDEDSRPLTVSEMRKLIEQQQKTIELLTNCILDFSEVIYK